MRKPRSDMYILRVSGPVPPRLAEYTYYALIFYAAMAPAWGIAVPLLGAGGMALLAMYCVWRLRKRGTSIYAPLFLPIGCAISFLVVRIAFYGASITDEYLRSFVTWILALIVSQSLLLREGFLHRFAAAAFILGLLLLPYLTLGYVSDPSLERAGLERSVGYANPNALAAWFGFCCVYFMILGIETRRQTVRMVSFPAAVGCLFVVGLTVSRGALLGIAIAVVVALRRLLKRRFLPVLFLTVFGSLILFSGLFDQTIGFYTERGTEESGRFLLWPLAIERLLDSPLVGVEDNSTYVPEMGKEISPHNGFLYIGLTSGIVPLALFVAYWVRAARGAYHLSRQGLQDASFQLPLIIYTFIIVSLGASDFMLPWAIVTLCNAIPRRASRIIALKASKREPVEPSGRGDEVVHASARQRFYIRSPKSRMR